MKTHQILTPAASLSPCGGGAAPPPTVKSIELTPTAVIVRGPAGSLDPTSGDRP
ncbi:hypothetical protein [Deinococcus sp. Arct2-2]|uniref:hypothetical protein n=1 Tax=Deinococcus sp. Arct2-2 TaxID=2568653 RepID=UPI001454C35E|nr:hypothetical protein [Deinococcus sp. Arct2-2]